MKNESKKTDKKEIEILFFKGEILMMTMKWKLALYMSGYRVYL